MCNDTKYLDIHSPIETSPSTFLTSVARRILQLDKLGWHGEKERTRYGPTAVFQSEQYIYFGIILIMCLPE